MDNTLSDKVSPNNIEAEMAVLGALLIDWGAMGDVITKLKPAQNKEILRDRLSDIIKPKEKSLIESSSISWDYNLDNLFKIR